MARDHLIRVTLDDDELSRLDELRPPGMSRPAFFRTILHEPPSGGEVATRTEALSILSGLARDGRVAAAIALERALRDEAPVADELDEILGGEVDGSR
jgi:hypothetical protein